MEQVTRAAPPERMAVAGSAELERALSYGIIGVQSQSRSQSPCWFGYAWQRSPAG